MMSPSSLSLSYPRAAAVLLVGIFFLGVFSYLITPRFESPQVLAPGFTVSTVYPGASPVKIEDVVTKPLEKAFSEIDGVEWIEGYSAHSVSYLGVKCFGTADMSEILEEAHKKVAEAKRSFPKEALKPHIMEFSTKDVPIIIYALSGDFTNRQFTDFSSRMQSRLSLISSVAEVIVEGVEDEEIEVMLSPESLERFKISVFQVAQALKASNIDIPGGSLDIDDSRFLVSAHNVFQRVTDVGECVIAYSGIAPLRLKDVATITQKPAKANYQIRYNRKRAVVLQVRMKGGGDVFKVTSACEKMVRKLKDEFPPDLEVSVVTNQRDSVAAVVETFEGNLFAGSLLVGGIILFHMGFRTSIVVLSAIPLSIFLAIAVMVMCGIEFHKISIFSLVLVLGMMVDAGIVMTENIFRQVKGESKTLSLAISGAASQVAVPLLSSTLTTIAAFVPLLFMGGITGKYIAALPLTVIIALLSSLATAVFFTPLLASIVINTLGVGSVDVRIPFVSDDFLTELHGWYVEKLLGLLNWRITVLFVSALFFGAAIMMIPFLGIEFFPNTDRGQFILEAALPAKSDLKSASTVAAEIEEILSQKSGISSVLAYIGKGVPRFHYNIYRRDSASYAAFLITVSRPSRIREIIDALRRDTSQIPGCKVTFQEVKEGPKAGFPVSCRVLGNDYDQVRDIALKVEEFLQSIPGAVDVERDSFEETPGIHVILDKTKAALLNIDGSRVSRLVRLSTEGFEATTIKEDGGEELPVVLRLFEEGTTTCEDLAKVRIMVDSGRGFVPLEQVARLEIIGEPSVRYRRRRSPTIRVRCRVDGVSASEILEKVKTLSRDLVPPGYTIEFGGENEYRNRSFKRLAKALLFALVLIFMILVTQFKSIMQPIVVLTCLPLSITGAVAGLFVTGYPFGFMAFLGFVALSGIVVNDAILLFDHINSRRAEGWDGRDAIVDACVIRHRAIYLTTITTMAGLLPLALTGGNLWAPLAWVIIFGIAISTFLTLIVIPAGYALVERI